MRRLRRHRSTGDYDDSWPHLLRVGALVVGFVVLGLVAMALLNQMG